MQYFINVTSIFRLSRLSSLSGTLYTGLSECPKKFREPYNLTILQLINLLDEPVTRPKYQLNGVARNVNVRDES